MVKKTKKNWASYFWASTRISLGLIFLWAFIDKMFGLGYATCNVAGTTTVGCSSAWVAGGSPASGFLSHVSGPFANFYSSLAGNVFIDWLFMLGLLGIGLALVLGIAMRLATVAGALLVFMMWTASLWPKNNPLLDDHAVYLFVLLGLGSVNKDQVWGLRKVWIKLPVVRSVSWLQ